MDVAFGRYRLLERLGQGGMAEVFKAKSFGVEGFEKTLVIKRILPELAKHPAFVDMFVREAKLAVRLSHANIVQVFDLGIADTDKEQSSYYIAMEYVHGFDLARLLHRTRQQGSVLPVPLCVYIAAEVAKGLDHAHRRRDEQLKPLGIVHCDVSPQNVLLSFEGEVKVTDFGIARARDLVDVQEDDDTFARRLRGKFTYMSPEQASGERFDARSDLYSLGVILYESLAGVNPFRAANTFETLRRVQAAEIPPIEILRPDVPKELVAVLATALHRDPVQRFADAGRMYEALLAFLYSHNMRYGSHDLAGLLAPLRRSERPPPPSGSDLGGPLDEGEAHAAERTPVEVPSLRAPRIQHASGTYPAQDLPSNEPLERREVTALVFEWPRASDDQQDARDPAVATRQVVERYGGRIIESETGQLVALFGLADPDGRDTEMATRAALVGLRAGGVSAGAGLHSGRVLLSAKGDVITDQRVTSLVQSARELARVTPGRVAISAGAMRMVKLLFDFEPLPDGHTQGLSISGVLVKELRRPADVYERFVGRKDEFKTVGEVLALCTRRRLHIITLRGDHGIGKTRLLHEVERRLRKGSYNIGYYMAACPPHGVDLPLSGIAVMLRTLCGTAEGDSEERIEAVSPRLRALGLSADEVSSVLAILGADVTTSATGSVLRNAVIRMMQSLSEDRPHAFVWDVAQCMDEASFEFLLGAHERLRNTRTVFVFAGRAGFTHALEPLSRHTGIELSDLAPSDSERLMALRLAVDAVPDELVSFVRARAGGHPLFIEEVLKALLDAHAVTVAERRVVSMRLVGQELALPKTLRGLVASRVTRLSPQVRGVLHGMCVLGEPLDAEILSTMLEQPIVQIDRALNELASQRFVVRDGAIHLQFASPLIPEIVTDTLPAERAQGLHARAGSALIASAGERVRNEASRIALHLYQAGERESAATYFAMSGQRALEARQFDAATQDLARAIALPNLSERTPEELARWLSRLSAAVRVSRSLPEANDLCTRVLVEVDAKANADVRVLCHVDTGHILAATHQFELANTHFQTAEKIAGDERELLMPVLLASAELSIRQGDFSRAHQLLERLQSFFDLDRDRRDRHKILVNLAQAHAATGDRARALSALEMVEQQAIVEPTSIVELEKLHGLIDYFSRDFHGAATRFERAVDAARTAELQYETTVNLHNLGDALVRLGDYPKAFGALQQSLALCNDLGYERLGSINRMFLAYLDGIAGAENAEALLRQGIGYARHHDFIWDVVSGQLLLAQLLLHRGQAKSAREEFLRLRDVADRAGNRLVVTDCERALSTLAMEPDDTVLDPV